MAVAELDPVSVTVAVHSSRSPTPADGCGVTSTASEKRVDRLDVDRHRGRGRVAPRIGDLVGERVGLGTRGPRSLRRAAYSTAPPTIVAVPRAGGGHDPRQREGLAGGVGVVAPGAGPRPTLPLRTDGGVVDRGRHVGGNTKKDRSVVTSPLGPTVTKFEPVVSGGIENCECPCDDVVPRRPRKDRLPRRRARGDAGSVRWRGAAMVPPATRKSPISHAGGGTAGSVLIGCSWKLTAFTRTVPATAEAEVEHDLARRLRVGDVGRQHRRQQVVGGHLPRLLLDRVEAGERAPHEPRGPGRRAQRARRPLRAHAAQLQAETRPGPRVCRPGSADSRQRCAAGRIVNGSSQLRTGSWGHPDASHLERRAPEVVRNHGDVRGDTRREVRDDERRRERRRRGGALRDVRHRLR